MEVGVIVALAVLGCAAAVGVITSGKWRPRRVAEPAASPVMREKYAGLASDCIQQAKKTMPGSWVRSLQDGGETERSSS